MGRGRGGRYSYGRGDVLSVGVGFNLSSSDENGNDITPTVGNANGITTYTFAGAVENFQGGFWDSSDLFEFDQISITEENTPSGEAVTFESPLTLDLTARYISKGEQLSLIDGTPLFDVFDQNETSTNRIEYTFSNPELTDVGVSEVTLVIPDQDKDTAGFQVNGKTIDTTNATNNLESISDTLVEAFSADNDYLNGTDGALDADESVELRVSGRANDNPNELESTSLPLASKPRFPVIIEAEDIVDDPNNPNDDTTDITGYEPEDYTQTDGSGLRLSPGETTGTISFEAQDVLGDDISGAYNLRVNTFDENDGEGSIKVEVKNSSGESKLKYDFEQDGLTINLDESTNSSFPTDDIFRSYVIKGLDLDPTDTITITGTFSDSVPNDGANRGGEFARIDFLTFDPVDI